MSSSIPIQVHLLPGLIPDRALEGGQAVVIDVLRATTVMVHALASGAASIRPCLEIDEALALAVESSPGTVILGGERRGLPIEGFNLGNSPASYTEMVCAGKSVVMTTTNGTRALLASLAAARVLVAGFVNFSATSESLEADRRPVHLVCAGTDGKVSLEDSLLAGAIASRLCRSKGEAANDEARLLSRLWDSLGVDGAEPETAESRLLQALSEGRGGRRVREIGLEADLADAARIDRFSLVAEVASDPTRVVRLA